MRQTLVGAIACLALCVALAPDLAKPLLAQDHAMEGEWVGSFGCEGKLTYFRMSVAATKVALHIHDETMLYKTSQVTEGSFDAQLIPPKAAPVNAFPTEISAMLVMPDDLLTGTLKGMQDVEVACNQFVMVRFVEWPNPASANGQLMVPAAWLSEGA